MIDSGKLQVTMRHGRMIVKLPAEILFASGSADISKGGENALAEVAGILKQMPERRFMIAGHTDNIPVGPPSPFKNNLQLSTARAERVTETLITAGMNPAHLSAAGYSEYEPARENSTEAGRRENRRIENRAPAEPRGDPGPGGSRSAGGSVSQLRGAGAVGIGVGVGGAAVGALKPTPPAPPAGRGAGGVGLQSDDSLASDDRSLHRRVKHRPRPHDARLDSPRPFHARPIPKNDPVERRPRVHEHPPAGPPRGPPLGEPTQIRFEVRAGGAHVEERRVGREGCDAASAAHGGQERLRDDVALRGEAAPERVTNDVDAEKVRGLLLAVAARLAAQADDVSVRVEPCVPKGIGPALNDERGDDVAVDNVARVGCDERPDVELSDHVTVPHQDVARAQELSRCAEPPSGPEELVLA